MIGFYAALFYVAAWLVLLVHEAGHVLAARLLGHAVVGLRLGSGHPKRRFEWKLFDLEITPWPSGGLTLQVPPGPTRLRLHDALITLAGPLASLGLLALAWLYL